MGINDRKIVHRRAERESWKPEAYQVGDWCRVGAGAIILPRVKIGNRSQIGAGAVVTKDIPENSVAIGVPARIVGEVE
jgi:acetyltransferase-like isoleucine patch superfamily enzyme